MPKKKDTKEIKIPQNVAKVFRPSRPIKMEKKPIRLSSNEAKVNVRKKVVKKVSHVSQQNKPLNNSNGSTKIGVRKIQSKPANRPIKIQNSLLNISTKNNSTPTKPNDSTKEGRD